LNLESSKLAYISLVSAACRRAPTRGPAAGVSASASKEDAVLEMATGVVAGEEEGVAPSLPSRGLADQRRQALLELGLPSAAAPAAGAMGRLPSSSSGAAGSSAERSREIDLDADDEAEVDEARQAKQALLSEVDEDSGDVRDLASGASAKADTRQ
jgi:hypothetical protein